jgi:hypothetical protein
LAVGDASEPVGSAARRNHLNNPPYGSGMLIAVMITNFGSSGVLS